MANTISQAFVEQFRSNVYQLSQQRGSRLGDTVRYEPLVGDVAHFERIGAVAAQNKPSRHSDTPILNAPHSGRRALPQDKEWGDLVDREDKLRMLISPESEYAIAGAYALGRAKDDIIIAAATGTALDGDGASVAFPSSQQVGTDIGGTGTNLNLAKVLRANKILNGNEAMEDDRYMVYGSSQEEAILQIAQFTSSDYAVQALMAGGVTRFLNFQWRRSERLGVASSVRSCLAYQRMGIGLAVNEDMFARIAERADKSFATQVYCRMTMGSVRIEEESVVEVLCTEP